MPKGNMEDKQAQQSPQGFLIKWRIIAAFAAAAVVAFIVPAMGFGENGEVVKQSFPLTVAAVSNSIVYTPNIADTLDSCFVVSGLPKDESVAAFNARIVYYNAGEDGSLDIERLSPPDSPGRYWAAAATDETDNFLPVVSAPISFEITVPAADLPGGTDDGTADEGMPTDAGGIPAGVGEAVRDSVAGAGQAGVNAEPGTLILDSAGDDPQEAEVPQDAKDLILAEGAFGDSAALGAVAAAADISPLASIVPYGTAVLSCQNNLQMKVPAYWEIAPVENNITIDLTINNWWGMPIPGAQITGAQMALGIKIGGASQTLSYYFDTSTSTISSGMQSPQSLATWLANTNNTFNAGTFTINLNPLPTAAGRTFEYTVSILDTTWPHWYGWQETIASDVGTLRVKNGVALTGEDNLHMVASGNPDDGRNAVEFVVSLAHEEGILANVQAGFVLYDEDEGLYVDWTTCFSADYSTIAINGGSPENLSAWLSHGGAGFSDDYTLTINLVPLASARGKTFSYRLDFYDDTIPSPNWIAGTGGTLHVLAAEYALPAGDGYISDWTRALLTKVYRDPDPGRSVVELALLADLKAWFKIQYPGDDIDYFLAGLNLKVNPREPGENVRNYPYQYYPYNISVSFDSVYTVTGSVTAGLRIVPRRVVITVGNASKYLGEADPAFTWTSDLLGRLTWALRGVVLSRVSGEDAGTYAVNATWQPNPNLWVTVVPGTLTIHGPDAYFIPASANILSGGTTALLTRAYGDAPPSDAEVQAAILGDLKAFFRSVYPSGANLEAFLGSLSLQASLPASSGYRDVGLHPYSISVSTADARYTITGSVIASLNVTKRLVALTVRDASKYQGEADPVLAWASDLPSWLAGALAGVNVTRAQGEAVGSYSISAAWTDNQNLEVTAGQGTFTIYRADKNGEYQHRLRALLHSGPGGPWYSPPSGPAVYQATGPSLYPSYSVPAPAGPAATAAAVNPARPSSAQTAPASPAASTPASSPTASAPRTASSPADEPAAPDSYRADAADPGASKTAAIAKTEEPSATPPSPGAGWSLANLILVALSGVLMLLLAGMCMRWNPGSEGHEPETSMRARRNFQFWIVSVIVLAAAVCSFVLTEDIHMPMTLLNRWTVLQAVILAMQITIFSFAVSDMRVRAAAGANQ